MDRRILNRSKPIHNRDKPMDIHYRKRSIHRPRLMLLMDRLTHHRAARRVTLNIRGIPRLPLRTSHINLQLLGRLLLRWPHHHLVTPNYFVPNLQTRNLRLWLTATISPSGIPPSVCKNPHTTLQHWEIIILDKRAHPALPFNGNIFYLETLVCQRNIAAKFKMPCRGRVSQWDFSLKFMIVARFTNSSEDGCRFHKSPLNFVKRTNPLPHRSQLPEQYIMRLCIFYHGEGRDLVHT